MMTRTELYNKVRDIIVDQLGVSESEVKPDTSLVPDVSTLGLNSLDLVEIEMVLEEEFKIEFDETAEAPDTVDDLVTLVQNARASMLVAKNYYG